MDRNPNKKIYIFRILIVIGAIQVQNTSRFSHGAIQVQNTSRFSHDKNVSDRQIVQI